MSAAETIQRLTEYVVQDEKRLGVLSTGEKLAVAMVLDRYDLLDGWTMLEAIERLGPEWHRAAFQLQRATDLHRRRKS